MAKKQPVKGAKPVPIITPPKDTGAGGAIRPKPALTTMTGRAAFRRQTESLGTRGNSISMSEAVRAVQYPESNSPETRAYYLMGRQELDTLAGIWDAGGDNEFLFPGQKAVWRDEDNGKNAQKDQRDNVLFPDQTPILQDEVPVSPASIGLCNPDQNAVNVLAGTAMTEGRDFGDETTIALMLTQYNYYIANGTWYQLGTWQGNSWTPQTVPSYADSHRVEIAQQFVEGACRYGNPLSQFEQFDEESALYDIADNLDVRYEVSIDSTRVEQFLDDPTYDLRYVVGIDNDRAVVVGNSRITDAWIGYQCPLGEDAVLGTTKTPSQIRQDDGALQVGENVMCQVCTRSSRQWWYRQDRINYELLSEVDFQARIRSEGGAGYVASC